MHPRFIMIGGFLGAGKTTTMARVGRHFQNQGKRVVLVTNDQASDLVDTHLLRSQGFQVGEVAGSCFCCNFNELTSTIERLSHQERPDVVLAEPVGSCTDLVATVLRPLEEIYNQPFDLAPYGVIVKPSHGAKILGRVAQGGFSPQAEYIFRKQIEEADFVMINRVDELPTHEVARLTELLTDQFPNRPIVRVSALTGVGFDALYQLLDRSRTQQRKEMEVDYDLYAQGEAELGWLNSQLHVTAERPFELDSFLLALLARLQQELALLSAETAHVKVIGQCAEGYAVANLISSFTAPQLSLASHGQTGNVELVINARVAMDPDTLARVVTGTIIEVGDTCAANVAVRSLQSFRPGRPVPTHRIAS